MAWQISGRSMELCSCNAFCPCWLGPDGKPDQDWCSGMFGFQIETGSSDGVDLAGTHVALMAHWPGNFFSGNGSARVYLDESHSEDQRRELEAIFSGNKGGLLEGLWGAVITTWLPAHTGRVGIDWGDNPSVKVDGVGEAALKPFRDGAGKATIVSGAAAQAAFQIDSMQLADGRDSNWSDPELGTWQADSATLHTFDWAA